MSCLTTLDTHWKHRQLHTSFLDIDGYCCLLCKKHDAFTYKMRIQKRDWLFNTVLKRNERSQWGTDQHNEQLWPIWTIMNNYLYNTKVTAISLYQWHFTFISPSYVRSPLPSYVRLLKTFQILSFHCSGFTHIHTSKHSRHNLSRYDNMMHNDLSRKKIILWTQPKHMTTSFGGGVDSLDWLLKS